jgi:hypothetical protein
MGAEELNSLKKEEHLWIEFPALCEHFKRANLQVQGNRPS